jgi:hypothetical protein
VTQASLFTEPDGAITRLDQSRLGHHHRNASKTEMRAARAQVHVGAGRRRQVLQAIVASGDTGLTRQEVTDFHGILLQSVCGRVKELLDADFVFETSRERQGRAVLCATERGRRAIT